ncbi:VOC family protein [Jeotgalibacillus sp. ET6]|uniref:VOC family protein n=1 Tax=Jeotgalibacillus sp. ET6 TaxID=3037260 RepID=UPI002418B674|nr:VOC family protein [Jeotgalibacillus sp. ET6]MDG5472234.1 VOC family protein [Jeotgalibacillus sp. ET6]
MTFHQPPASFVGQIELMVRDIARSLAFYESIIGLKLISRDEKSAKLSADGSKSILSLVQPEEVKGKEPRTTGLYHFALLLPARSDLADLIAHLVKNGVKMGGSDHGVSEAVYFDDPDGNGIEVYRDRSHTEWDWHDSQVSMAIDPLNIQELLSGEQKEWRKVPEKTVIGHLHLHVSELGKTQEFYKEGLGLDVVSRINGQALFMSSAGYHHHIGLNTWQGVGAPPPSKNSVGLHWFSFVVRDEKEKMKTVERLQKLNYAVYSKDGCFTTQDPSGNQIKLVTNEEFSR